MYIRLGVFNVFRWRLFIGATLGGTNDRNIVFSMIEEGRCDLWSDCKYPGACGLDVYMIPGYREEDMEFDHTVKFTDDWNSDSNKIYKCYLPYDKCKHDPYCVADSLKEQVEKNSEKNPVALIGFCYGGIVSQVYAAKNPDRVKKLALIQTTDMSRTSPTVIRTLKLKDVDNARKVNYQEIRDNVKSDAFVYNCIGDRLLSGNPPNIKKAQVKEDIMCVHGQIPKTLGSKAMRFVNKR